MMLPWPPRYGHSHETCWQHDACMATMPPTTTMPPWPPCAVPSRCIHGHHAPCYHGTSTATTPAWCIYGHHTPCHLYSHYVSMVYLWPPRTMAHPWPPNILPPWYVYSYHGTSMATMQPATVMPPWPPWYIHSHHVPCHHDASMVTMVWPQPISMLPP